MCTCEYVNSNLIFVAIAADAAERVKIDGMTVAALNGYLNFTIEREAFVRGAFAAEL